MTKLQKSGSTKLVLTPRRLSRLDEDNFWQMGDTGPCGPCTEIFWDHGEDIPGGPPGSEDDDLDRYIEIWNLVFMQFERDSSGKMTPLPKPSIDTGMGLERIAAVMQGVHNNYDIDLFQHLIKSAAQIIGCTDLQENSLKVVADHIRSCAFLVVDGVRALKRRVAAMCCGALFGGHCAMGTIWVPVAASFTSWLVL